MRKWLAAILAAMAVYAGNLSAQTFAMPDIQNIRVPDEEDVLAKIMDSNSPFYYPPMMLRFLAGDLSLTQDHYFYLYYGFAYDEAFDPRAGLPGENRILEIFAQTDTPDHAQAQTIIDAAKENMLIDPFNPGNINMMTFAYGILGDTINEIVSNDRFTKIIAAIQSSGTGRRENSPWHILRFSHANDVVASMGFTIESRQVRTRTVEYVRLNRNSDLRGLFFDFGRVYWVPSDGEAVRRTSRWRLNDIPL